MKKFLRNSSNRTIAYIIILFSVLISSTVGHIFDLSLYQKWLLIPPILGLIYVFSKYIDKLKSQKDNSEKE
ncbi:hypothetical protein MNBD_GAMMA01-2199 [hydrothermal vent metagenome]|uniref:Uncharacterized protein n=1 Tax=hydrothermal vent metagenome TaxID=652676 RepID=A0A3B0V888_9ZZZZ